MRYIHLAVVLLVCSFITLSFTKSTVVYRRYHRKRPALRKTHKNVIEIVEVFKTNRKPPAFIKSDRSIEKFLVCDAKCERKIFLKKRKMCIRRGRFCPTRPSRPKNPTKTEINVSSRPIYNKPTVYDRNPFGNRNPDYTHLYPWSRPSVTVTKYTPDGSKNFNMTIVEVKNDTIPTTVKDDYEYYDVDNDDRQQHRRSCTFRVPTNHEFSTAMKTIETTTPIPLTTVSNALPTTTTTSTVTISSSSEYFSTTIGTSTFTISTAATEAYAEGPQSTTLKTFVTTPVIDASPSTHPSPVEYWSSLVQPEPTDRATTEYFIASTTPKRYAPNTASPAVEISTTETLTTERTTTERTTTERTTTERTTTERTTTERSTTEALTTEALTTEALTTEALTTETLTTEALTSEALTTEALTTEALTTEALTTEAFTTEAFTTEALTTEALTTEITTTEILITESQSTSTTEELTTPSTTSTSTTEISTTLPTTTQPVSFPSSTVGLNLSTDATTSATENSSPNGDEDEYIEEDYEGGDEEIIGGEEGEEGGEEITADGEGENGQVEETYDYDDDGNYDEDEEQ